MEWIFNGNFGNREVYELVTGGIASVFLNIRENEYASYQIYYNGGCKEGTINFSNCLSSRRVEFCKEAVEEKFLSIVKESFEKEKHNFEAVRQFVSKRREEQASKEDYSDYDILR